MTALKNLNRWVMVPSQIAGVAGAVLGVTYSYLTIDFPPETLKTLFGCIAGLIAITGVLGDRVQQGALQTLRQLGQGRREPTRDALSDAVRELSQVADLSFWLSMGLWWGGATGIAVVYANLANVDVGIAARLAFVGFALGPLVSMLTHLGIVLRARVAIVRVAAAGLTPREVIAAIPPQRMQLQRRLVVYAGVAVGTPMLMVVDLVVRHTERAFEAVLGASEAPAQSALLAAQVDQGLFAVVLVGGLVAALVLVCGYVSGSVLGGPLRALAAKTRAMAGGKLGGSTVVAGEDETWAAVAGFSSLETQLVAAVVQLQDAGRQIQTTTDALGASRTRHERGTAEQTAALAQTSATTEELAKSARQIASNATHVAELASQTLAAARLGKTNADQFYLSILKVREGNQAIADSVVKLNKRVQQVGRIVEFIDGIADKSDLLALNAELEGNKAGEVGRGFSLVAAEMRRLAESVMTSTREIIGLIHEVRDATNAAVMATEAGVKASDTGSGLARKVSEGLSDILGYATTTADAVQRITLATHQQQVGTDQLAQAMADILQSTRSGEGSAKRMAAANDQLQGLAHELKDTVGRFEVGS